MAGLVSLVSSADLLLAYLELGGHRPLLVFPGRLLVQGSGGLRWRPESAGHDPPARLCAPGGHPGTLRPDWDVPVDCSRDPAGVHRRTLPAHASGGDGEIRHVPAPHLDPRSHECAYPGLCPAPFRLLCQGGGVSRGATVFAGHVAAAPGTSTVIALGCVTMLVGALFAMLQVDLKRLLAFSTISQLGYILTGLGLGTDLGIGAGLFYCFSHGLFKGTLFLCCRRRPACDGHAGHAPAGRTGHACRTPPGVARRLCGHRRGPAGQWLRGEVALL